MAVVFFDLIAEESSSEREDEMHEFMQTVEDQLEELFSMLFALTLRITDFKFDPHIQRKGE